MTAWIFQGNPKLFDVTTYLRVQKRVSWRASQGHTMMAPGDIVYFWRSMGDGSEHSGIIASGTIVEGPLMRDQDPAGASLWRSDNPNPEKSLQVAIDLDVPAGQQLLPAAYLRTHAALKELEIIRVPNATNFRVLGDMAHALAQCWDKAKTISANAFLALSLQPVVDQWLVEPKAQSHTKKWSEAAKIARPEVASLVRSFLEGAITLPIFKETFDNESRSARWRPLGLGGSSGAMVLNKWTKHFSEEEITPELQMLLALPTDADEAERKMRAFAGTLEKKVAEGEVTKAQAEVGRIPALVSAVWQSLATDGADWPTQYTSARDRLFDLKVLLKRDDKIASYLEYRAIFRQLLATYHLDVDQVHQLLRWRDEPTKAPEAPSPPPVPDAAKKQIWLISPGEGGSNWATWTKEGIAAVEWNRLGDLSKLTSLEETAAALTEHYGNPNPINDKWSVFSFAHLMKEGDLIFAKKGRKGLLGYGTVQGNYRYDPGRSEEHHVIGVKWHKLSDVNLPDDRVFIIKTLTEISSYPELVQVLFDLAKIGDAPSEPVENETRSTPAYTQEDATRDLFIEPASLQTMLSSLQERQNLILQGPPGVGKTFVAKRLAYLLMGERSPEQVKLVQFHQSYSYEDFVQGFRPTESGGFQRNDGPFVRFCAKAKQDPHSPYVLIIDEINRGNVSRIFGELLMLLEADKRSQDWGVELAYSKAGEAPFFVPPNVYVIGTMNTADRSLALVDYALRRRFTFLDIEPGFEASGFIAVLKEIGLTDAMIGRVTSSMNALNRLIEKDPHLGPGYKIGHSYFCAQSEYERDEDWLQRVFDLEVQPLLREYWRDSPEKLKLAEAILEES